MVIDCGFGIADSWTTLSNDPAAIDRIAGRFQQRHAAGFDNFLVANRPSAFAGFCLKPDLKRAKSQDARDTMANRVLVIRQFWPLGVNDAIEVHNLISGFGHLCSGNRQHLGRIATPIGRVRIRKQSADIGQGGSAEQSVGHRMQQDIGIAVTDKLSVMRHIDASKTQRSARGGAMRVVANSNPQIARGANSRFQKKR
jgi:hypothetical protein